MNILAGILMSLYLGLTLFGLCQCKAHDRSWGVIGTARPNSCLVMMQSHGIPAWKPTPKQEDNHR